MEVAAYGVLDVACKHISVELFPELFLNVVES